MELAEINFYFGKKNNKMNYFLGSHLHHLKEQKRKNCEKVEKLCESLINFKTVLVFGRFGKKVL
jgi:hypothetical protein